MYLTWNNVALPDFIKVTEVTKTSLPTFEHTLVKVVGKMGFQYAGTVYGSQMVTVDFIFVEQPSINVDEMPRYLANFFGLDSGELRLVNKPGFSYKALLDPPPDIVGIATWGEGSLTFNCYEGFALSDTVFDEGENTMTTSDTVSVNNVGDLPTRPTITIIPSGTLNGFRLVNQTTGELVIADFATPVASGVKIIIDMYREEVYLETGASLMPYVSLNSTFWDLVKGTNSIRLDNPYGSISANWKVMWRTKEF